MGSDLAVGVVEERPELDGALDGSEVFFDGVLLAVQVHQFFGGVGQVWVGEQKDESGVTQTAHPLFVVQVEVDLHLLLAGLGAGAIGDGHLEHRNQLPAGDLVVDLGTDLVLVVGGSWSWPVPR